MRAALAAALLCVVLAAPFARGGTLALQLGGRTVEAEVADTPESRARGLMQRTSLCADCGMLFVFEEPGPHAFWMENTPLPLSIAFIDRNGVILNIAEMQPYTREQHSSRDDALYALEMNRGWFARNGVRAGDRLPDLKR